MSLTIEDPEIVAAIRKLAADTHRSVEQVVREALEAARLHEEERLRRRAILTDIQERFAALPSSGLKADKAFYDSLNDDDR